MSVAGHGACASVVGMRRVPPSGPRGLGDRAERLSLQQRASPPEKDQWGNQVINPEFNAAMLAEAMCKLEGFRFEPDPEVYWQQGRSTETDCIYVTTRFMSKVVLAKLSDEDQLPHCQNNLPCRTIVP